MKQEVLCDVGISNVVVNSKNPERTSLLEKANLFFKLI